MRDSLKKESPRRIRAAMVSPRLRLWPLCVSYQHARLGAPGGDHFTAWCSPGCQTARADLQRTGTDCIEGSDGRPR